MIGIFIDDTRDLEVPHQLRDKDIEWHLFRDLRSLYNSEVFRQQRADYVCFDYYLDDRGRETGLDAIRIVSEHYFEQGWELPAASFHSSDPSCNIKMGQTWRHMRGPVLVEEAKPLSAGRQAVVAAVEKKKRVSGVAIHFRRNK